MTPGEAEVRKKIFDESKRYRDPDCFVLGAGYGSGVFADLYRKDGIDKFKSALREEIEKMQNECTDDGEYKVLEQLKEKLNTVTPKK